MTVHYTDLVQWYCDVCGDLGEAGSQHEAERQVEDHAKDCKTQEEAS